MGSESRSSGILKKKKAMKQNLVRGVVPTITDFSQALRSFSSASSIKSNDQELEFKTENLESKSQKEVKIIAMSIYDQIKFTALDDVEDSDSKS